jgi:hypothetical protein
MPRSAGKRSRCGNTVLEVVLVRNSDETTPWRGDVCQWCSDRQWNILTREAELLSDIACSCYFLGPIGRNHCRGVQQDPEEWNCIPEEKFVRVEPERDSLNLGTWNEGNRRLGNHGRAACHVYVSPV